MRLPRPAAVSAAAVPSRIARDGSRSLSLRIVEAVVNALVLFVTARGFGADGRGLYALTMLAATFMALPVLGITALVLALALLGDSVRDAFDPKTRR